MTDNIKDVKSALSYALGLIGGSLTFYTVFSWNSAVMNWFQHKIKLKIAGPFIYALIVTIFVLLLLSLIMFTIITVNTN